MKKTLLSVTVCALVGMVIFGSCKKDEEALATGPTLTTATITGKLTANTDLRNDTAGVYNEKVAAGVTVIGVINTGEWYRNKTRSSYEYSNKVYSTTTDANGAYTLSIEVADQAVTVNMSFSDFYADQQQDTTLGRAPSVKNLRYYAPHPAVIVESTETVIEDVIYTN